MGVCGSWMLVLACLFGSGRLSVAVCGISACRVVSWDFLVDVGWYNIDLVVFGGLFWLWCGWWVLFMSIL